MSKYKVTYSNGDTEEVAASGIYDRNPWIDFEDGGGLVLRVLAARVLRIERAA